MRYETVVYQRREQIGEITLQNIKADILPDDSPYARKVDGIIGLACFKKTIVVLDFQKSRLWLRK